MRKKYKYIILISLPLIIAGIFYYIYPPLDFLCSAWGTTIRVCVDADPAKAVVQPACYTTLSANPTFYWSTSSPSQEVCDCDNNSGVEWPNPGDPEGSVDCPDPPPGGGCGLPYTSYELKLYNGDTCLEPPRKTYVGGTATSTQIPLSDNLALSTTYSWKISITDSAGSTTPEMTCQVFDTAPGCAPTAPSIPDMYQAYDCDIHKAGFEWTDNSDDEDGFELQANSGSGWVVIWSTTAVAGSGSTVQAPKDEVAILLDGEIWDFRVRAYNVSGSSYSPELQNQLINLCAPNTFTRAEDYDCSSFKIGFSWTDESINEVGYNLQRSTSSMNAWYTVCDKSQNDTQCLIGDPNNTIVFDGVDYEFRVEVYNAVTRSYSAIRNESIFLCPPTITQVFAPTCDTMYFEWIDNSLNEDRYPITINNISAGGVVNPCGLPGLPGVSGVGNTISCLDNMSEATDWNHIQVRAFDLPSGDLESLADNWSLPIATTTPICAPEFAPANLTVSQVTCTTVDVTWEDTTTRETKFEVDMDLGGGWIIPVCDPDTNNGPDDSGIINGGNPLCGPLNISNFEGLPINFRVSACNDTGCGPESIIETIRTDLCAPTGLTMDRTTNCNTMNFNITDGTNNETGFVVEKRDTDTPGVWQVSQNACPPSAGVGGSSPCSDSGMVDGINWEFRAKAINAATSSLWFGPVNDWTMLCPPSNFSSSTLSCISELGYWLVDFGWDNNSATNDGYEIMRNKNMPDIWELLPPDGLVTPALNRFASDLVRVAKTWNYRIRTFNQNVASSTWAPDDFGFTVTADPYCSPKNLIALSVTCECIDISWDIEGDESSITEYEVRRDTLGSPIAGDIINELIGTTSPPTKNFSDCDIVSDTGAHVYRVIAQDAGAVSSELVISNPCPTLPVWWEIAY